MRPDFQRRCGGTVHVRGQAYLVAVPSDARFALCRHDLYGKTVHVCGSIAAFLVPVSSRTIICSPTKSVLSTITRAEVEAGHAIFLFRVCGFCWRTCA